MTVCCYIKRRPMVTSDILSYCRTTREYDDTTYLSLYISTSWLSRKFEPGSVCKRLSDSEIWQQTISLHDVGGMILYDVTCTFSVVIIDTSSYSTRWTTSYDVK